MNYCSKCGSSDIGLQVPTGDNRPRYVCNNCGTIHYTNPNIIAGCLPIWEDKVLLCSRAIEPRLGYWNVPSGFLENGETVEEGAVREVWEEAEAKVQILNLHAVFSLPQVNQVYIHYLGELIDGKFGVGEESLESQLFSEEEIPWKEIAFNSSIFTLKRYFEDRRKGLHVAHQGFYRHVRK
ncbi:MAG: NUDIX hydrolase [Bacteroidota bacterium]